MFKQSKRSIIDSILMKDDSILKKASHGEDYQLTMVQFLSTILRLIETLQVPKNGWIREIMMGEGNEQPPLC